MRTCKMPVSAMPGEVTSICMEDEGHVGVLGLNGCDDALHIGQAELIKL